VINSKKVLLVAGMRHSGSTALFNIIRLSLNQIGVSLVSGYSERLDLFSIEDSEFEQLLIKTHEPRDDVLGIADIIITTKRDLRETVASAARRKFYLLEKLGGVVEYAKYNRLLHEYWSQKSHYEFTYETFLLQPEESIAKALDFLKIDGVDIPAVFQQIQNLPTDNYKETLLTPEHITDPERKLNFSETLKTKDIIEIERDSHKWLTDNGYNL
jgi:hypothetical protein